MSVVKFLNEIKEPKVSELGGKGYSLAMLTQNGFNVPIGFVIVSTAFFEYLKANNLMNKIEKLVSEIDEDNFQEKSKEIRSLIINGKLPDNIAKEIEDNLKRLNVRYVSVRSSGVAEDSLKASFAGLHDTFLNVKAELNSVLENVKKCWASLFNDRAVIYRIKKEIPHLEGMAVIIQEMIPAEVSGITFTVHPNNKKAMLIELVQGTGDILVSGQVTPESFTIDRKTYSIVTKKVSKEGIISNKQIIKVANICLQIEKAFSLPQDIEWCIYRDVIWILQSRAITTIKKREHKENVILSGLGASPGVAQGKVKIILSPKEVSKINDGEILVTVMTNPLYITAIQKAKAIITDVGGVICHAAIVARELGIPCVVGTTNATKVLKDNMEVIVNGTKGKVYRAD